MIEIDKKNITSAKTKHFDGLIKIIKKRLNHSPKYRTPKYIVDFITDNLKTILIGEPKHLMKLYPEYEKTIRKKDKKAFNKYLKCVFNYNAFTKKKPKKYDAYNLAAHLDIRVCTYCNRQYTITVVTGIKDSEHITRPQFDHFFSQKDFPLLSLSFYNLIPSCSICNSTLKGSIEFNLKEYMHPYIDKYLHLYRFSYHPTTASGGLGHSPSLKVDIKFDSIEPELEKKIKNALEVFKIKEIYNGHIEEVAELVKLKRIMNDNYLKILALNTYPSLPPLKKEELYRLAFGVYYEEEYFYKRPFSKLKKDILKELGII